MPLSATNLTAQLRNPSKNTTKEHPSWSDLKHPGPQDPWHNQKEPHGANRGSWSKMKKRGVCPVKGTPLFCENGVFICFYTL